MKSIKYKVLVFEDNEDMCDILESYFHSNAPEIELQFKKSCVNGEEAILSFQPDLILLDFVMPGICGLNFIRKLDNKNLIDKIPIIIVTAFDKIELKEIEFPVITKPFDLETFLQIVRGRLQILPQIKEPG